MIGPDGKVYPAWHPPTGPGGCTFGHEHGRDPRGSDLYRDIGSPPFGYANEVRAEADPANPRDEDHVGHKIEWENDLVLRVGGDGAGNATAVCDVLYKIHQGSHSKDAFTNNLHEVAYHLRCDEGTEVHLTLLLAIGAPGGFTRACTESDDIAVGPPTPANSPPGLGIRYIPDRECVERHMLLPAGQASNYVSALHERWNTLNIVDRSASQPLVFFNPHFHVELPSRFYDPALPSAIGRPIDVCYETDALGERASGGACAVSTDGGATTGVAYDDPRSRFNGAQHSIQLNVTRLTNAGGPTVWYTDALGHHAAPEPFEHSIRQHIAAVNSEVGVDFDEVFIGAGRDYAGPGVRSPN
ncbi:MAG TPA: hypothetical protein VEB59_10665 [Gemmatimonadales bacterium]|nr:hypothetical protein [Gemmatimonadales bacterium]